MLICSIVLQCAGTLNLALLWTNNSRSSSVIAHSYKSQINDVKPINSLKHGESALKKRFQDGPPEGKNMGFV